MPLRPRNPNSYFAANQQVTGWPNSKTPIRSSARKRWRRCARSTASRSSPIARPCFNGDPSLPPALVQGQTIDEVDAALEKARGVVEYVREKVLAGNGAGLPGQTARAAEPPPRVPAGAPGRTLPDLSGMTAREKLIFGTSFAASGR